MGKINSLSEIISFNSSFRSSVNLYLSLNKPAKVLEYIPTKSSVHYLEDYLKAAHDNKEQATLMIGPYGKGKSHLILVLLAILSLERTKENDKVIKKLADKIRSIDEIGNEVADLIDDMWGRRRFLPVLVTDIAGDVNQAFLYGLNDALKRERLTELTPDTYFSIALARIDNWMKEYPDTYDALEREVKVRGSSMKEFTANLKLFSRDALNLFKEIYPKITAGSEFNPMAVSDVLPLYKNVSEKLVDDYGYQGMYIVFDEFSKFIESQDGTATGTNMKLIQDVCELATNSQSAKVFFTMVAHKSIKEYGKNLSSDIINSFTGIEGRLVEKYFITSSKNNYELIKNAIIKKDGALKDIPCYDRVLGKDTVKKYYQLPVFKANYLEKEFESVILRGCFPLNPISSYLLLNVSEKVAQNERTLFTFISNDEPHSMARFVSEHQADMDWSIGADLIYDYFNALFKKEVANEHIHNVWLSAEYAIDKCENCDQVKIAKALAVILIVNKEDEIPAEEKYLSLCTNVRDAALTIGELESKKVIYKKGSTGTYVFKTRAGSELKSEIKKRRELKGDNVKYPSVFQGVTGKYYVVPRKYNAVHMMTRYFANEYMEADAFLSIASASTLLSDCQGDGKVINLFSFSGIKQDAVKKHLHELADERLIVVCPKSGIKMQKQLKDFEILQELMTSSIFSEDNEILIKELPLMAEDLTKELEDAIDSLYDSQDTKVLYFNGERVKSAQSGDEETIVGDCCDRVYRMTPIVNNEMVNKAVISTGQTKKARISVIQVVLNHEDTPEFFEGTNQEATIYRSLYCETGIKDGSANEKIGAVLDEINSFVDSCSDEKRSLITLIETLTAAPYGMRKGVIPFYIGYALANRCEDIIVYYANKEMQLSAEAVVDMVENSDDYSIYVSKADIQKEKYLKELNALFQVGGNRNLSSNRIKDIVICMQRWFRALPLVARNVAEIGRYIDDKHLIMAMKEIKRTLQRVDFNPFEILFIEYPDAFGTQDLEDTYKIIAECKKHYDDYFDWMQEETAKSICNIWENKKGRDLHHILKEWYEKQSMHSKQGLYNGRITNFMSCLETLNVFSDHEVSRKIVKAISNVYMEDWNEGSLEDFVSELNSVKQEIEAIRDDNTSGEMELSFVSRNGDSITRLYSHADEGQGSVLRNILEDTLEEYDDLSVNCRVSILLDMIEKIIR